MKKKKESNSQTALPYHIDWENVHTKGIIIIIIIMSKQFNNIKEERETKPKNYVSIFLFFRLSNKKEIFTFKFFF